MRDVQTDPQLGLYNYTISRKNPSNGKLTGKNATLSLAPTWEDTVNNMIGNLTRPPQEKAALLGVGKSAMLPPDFRKKTR